MLESFKKNRRFNTLTRKHHDRLIIPIIKELPKGKVLEIGALHSPYKEYISCNEYRILDIKKRDGVDYVENIHQTTLEENSFDTIIATQVLEHLYHPHRAVKEMHRILKKGGTAIVSTVFIYPYHGEPYDYFRFTKYGLGHLFKNFSKTEIISFGNTFNALIELITTKNKYTKLFRFFTGLLTLLPQNNKTKNPLGFIVIAHK